MYANPGKVIYLFSIPRKAFSTHCITLLLPVQQNRQAKAVLLRDATYGSPHLLQQTFIYTTFLIIPRS